jgi:hypothetical protein
MLAGIDEDITAALRSGDEVELVPAERLLRILR